MQLCVPSTVVLEQRPSSRGRESFLSHSLTTIQIGIESSHSSEQRLCVSVVGLVLSSADHITPSGHHVQYYEQKE